MATTTRYNFDIVDLANKDLLVGVGIHMKDGTIKIVRNHYCDWGTFMISIIFEGETKARSYRFDRKFTVEIVDTYNPIKDKKLDKEAKDGKDEV